MKLLKILLIATVVLGGCLFGSGVYVLNYINSASPTTATHLANSVLDDLVKEYTPHQNPVNILFMVSDKHSGLTDTIMVVNYNPNTSKINVISIPRDTKSNLKRNYYHRINAAFSFGGGEHAVDRISSMLGVNINYYVKINISTIKEIVDLLGGVDYDVPVDMDYDDGKQDLHIHLKKGLQHLDGDKVEQLLRFRKPKYGRYTSELLKHYDGSDLKRIDTQHNFLRELIKQKTDIKYILKVKTVLDTLYKQVDTSVNLNVILKLILNIDKVKMNNMETFRLLGQSDRGGDYVYTQRIMNSKTKDVLDGSTVIEQYFKAVGGYKSSEKYPYSLADINAPRNTTSSTVRITPSKATTKTPVPTKNPKSTNFAKNNPSNNQTAITPDPTPKP